jgi:haloalkane dehalogenase
MPAAPDERVAVAAYRTPDERFADLPEFPYEPRYRTWGGLRLAYLDEGAGRPLVMLHGEPTWSFMYRKLIPPLVAAGYRCVIPDLPGFGRSDKPLEESWYSQRRHAEAVGSLLDELGIEDVALVMHDWGGPIGLTVATGEQRERVSAFFALDTAVLTGEQSMGENWEWFRSYVERTPDFPVGRMVGVGCRRRPSRDVVRGYDAPFPDAASKAGPRSFPRMVPLSPDAAGAAEGRRVAAALRSDPRPATVCWAEHDGMFPLETVGRQAVGLFPGAGPPTVIEGAGHFAPEDRGERIAAEIARWLG